MGSCTVSGLWNQVHGIGPFISEQEFMAENINLLCQLLSGGGGIGGGAPDVFVGDGPPTPGTPQPGQNATRAATYYDRQEGYLAYPWDPSLPPSGDWVGV